MPTDSTATEGTSQAAGDSAARLEEVRARVTELRRRIKTERDPKAQAELRAEVGELTAELADLLRARAANGGEVRKGDAVVWPRDLNVTEHETAPEWGADPEELARG